MLEMYKQFYSMNRSFQKGLFLKQGKKKSDPSQISTWVPRTILREKKKRFFSRFESNKKKLTVIDGKEEMVFQEFGV